MTRQFPLVKGVPGEDQDHPWQCGLYFAHGAVNGADFWNGRTASELENRVVCDKLEAAEILPDGTARVVLANLWKSGDKILLRDRSTWSFGGLVDGSRFVELELELKASEGEVKFGDNKEGCFAIRLAPPFSLGGKAPGQALNSAGVSGAAVWGKDAAWICYTAPLEGQVVSVAMFDHPDNLRHPTPWHARDYGLLAANPFALSAFRKLPPGTGDFVLKKGDTLRLRYRLLLFPGAPEVKKLEETHKTWVCKASELNLEPSSKPESAAKPKNPALVQVEDTPGLPRVLIFGDSISMGYTLPVRAKLKGIANLHRPAENCGDTKRGLAQLDQWLGKGHWDVIHFNFGLHDLKYLNAKGEYVSAEKGTQVASPQVYRDQLRQIVLRLKATGAKLIFATTTPIPAGARGRIKGDEQIYNQVAMELMKEQGIPVNDLCANVVARQEQEAQDRQLKPIQYVADVHFTDAGSSQLADQVFASIKKALP